MKNLVKKVVSIVLVCCILSCLVTSNVNAINISGSNETTASIWKTKIDKKILDKFDTLDKNEKMPVWVWFTDVSQATIDKKVEEKNGLTLDSLSMKQNYPTKKFVDLLSNTSNKEKIRVQKDKIKTVIESYLDKNKEERANNYKRTKLFLKTKRSIVKETYSTNNKIILEQLGISSESILYKSKLTPLSILNLNKKQIFDVAKNEAVESIDYSELSESNICPPDNNLSGIVSNSRQVMNVDAVQNIYGLTGNGVNVLVLDHGWVRPSQELYNQLNTDKIKNVYKNTIYDTTNEQVLPTVEVVGHPNLTVGELQQFTPDVNIYCVSTPFQYEGYDKIKNDVIPTLKELEWAIINHKYDAHIVDASCCLQAKAEYTNISKWFDALISTCNITVIASSGNSIEQHDHVITPANAYNTIAIGAYNTNGNATEDYRHNYVYKPTASDNEINYKPDMLAAAGSTSEAAPALTGIASMLIEYDPTLAAKPELLKAILMASCHRKVKPSPQTTDSQELIEDGLTQQQGSGAVDAYKALSILMQNNYYMGEINSGSVQSESIKIGINNSANVSLVWLRNNSLEFPKYDISQVVDDNQQELKLEVLRDNSIVGVSDKINTYKQMVYFENGTENLEYKIKVSKTSGTNDNTRYAYAWSTKDNYITLHTDNPSGVLTRSEAYSQISEAGILIGNGYDPFYVGFDDSINTIDNETFRGYQNLAGVYLEYGISKIGDSAFRDCDSLKNIEIPDGLLTIDNNAFRNCRALATVGIGGSVRSIGEKAFYNCSSLFNVKFMKYIAPTIRENAFTGIAGNAKGYITPRAVGYADRYDNLEIIHSTDIRTIYFTNNKNWDNLYAYMWNGNVSYYNQTKALQYSYMNHLGQDVYLVTVDANQYDMIKFIGDDGNHKTVSIVIGDNGTEYYTTSGNAYSEYYVSTYMPDVRTIYFTNNNNWSDVRAYLWKTGTLQNNIWHGLPMNYSHKNENNQDVYTINLDYNEYDCVVFNDYNSSNQTVDISIGPNGIGYYLTGNKSGNKWMVSTYN